MKMPDRTMSAGSKGLQVTTDGKPKACPLPHGCTVSSDLDRHVLLYRSWMLLMGLEVEMWIHQLLLSQMMVSSPVFTVTSLQSTQSGATPQACF